LAFFKLVKSLTTTCRHGVLGGLEARRCNICVAKYDKEQKKIAAEKNYAAQRQAHYLANKTEIDLLNQIKIEADEIKINEVKRLKDYYIPKIEDIYSLNPFEFEDFVSDIFVNLGYRVNQTKKTNDQGRDAIMHKSGKKYLLECKRYDFQRSSGRPEIQKFHSAIVHDDAAGGFFVTTGKFTDTAVLFAHGKEIELIDGDKIRHLFMDAHKNSYNDDTYLCMCRKCGVKVTAYLSNESAITCPNGHNFGPEIRKKDVFVPRITNRIIKKCPECNSAMKKVKGPYGYFYGCIKYPKCKGKSKSK
jgi:HJR/Mrr/RecB family endonuclease